jgi:Transcriptional regulatory protein, C terminal
LTSLNRF